MVFKKWDGLSGTRSGFTLVELSVVMAMIALLATFGLDIIGTTLQRTAHATTTEKLDKIEERLAEFLAANGRYPCPSSPTAGYIDANYGTENCSSTGGTVLANGALIGALPIRALHLPLDFMGDSWEQKFTYAVTELLTTTAGYTGARGNLRITGGNFDNLSGPSPSFYHLTSNDDEGAYVVLSHGADGKGAYATRGTTIINDCIPDPAALHDDMLDVENCDHTMSGEEDNWFMSPRFNDGEVENRFFDDRIRWEVTPSSFVQTTPCPATSSISWASGCNGALPAGIGGDTETLIDSSGPDTGTATYICNAGIWSLQPGSSCATSCTPVDGGFGPWQDVIICPSSQPAPLALGSNNCDVPIKSRRFRECNNPSPSCGGAACVGPALEEMDCGFSAPGCVIGSYCNGFAGLCDPCSDVTAPGPPQCP